MVITNISDAKANLSRLIEKTQHGETVIISKAGKPIAVLTAYNEDNTPRQLGGSWEGRVIMSDAFDELPEALTHSFYNSKLFPNPQDKD